MPEKTACWVDVNLDKKDVDKFLNEVGVSKPDVIVYYNSFHNQVHVLLMTSKTKHELEEIKKNL